MTVSKDQIYAANISLLATTVISTVILILSTVILSLTGHRQVQPYL